MSANGTGGSRVAAADLAAAALLGALLWDPQRIHDVADWLEAEDFRRWSDRAIYRTLTGMRADGRPIDLMTLPDVLARGEYHDVHVERGDGRGPLAAAALHSLLALTPATPRQDSYEGPVRSEHVRYARLVLDDSIRRQVEATGTRIDQYARHVAGQDSVSAAEVLAPVLADVEARLQELAGRLGAADPPHSIAAALNAETAVGRRSDGRAEKGLSSGSPAGQEATPTQLRRAEQTLVGSCLVSTDVRRLTEGRLREGDFNTPELAATWHAISTLQQRGEPVDFVLVAAEVERQGELPGIGRGLAPEELARLVARFAPVTAVAGYKTLEVVAHAAITRTMQATHAHLEQLAGNRAQPSNAILAGAQRAVETADKAVHRLAGTPQAAAWAALTPPAAHIPAARGPQSVDRGAPRPAAPDPGAPAQRRR